MHYHNSKYNFSIPYRALNLAERNVDVGPAGQLCRPSATHIVNLLMILVIFAQTLLSRLTL